MNTMISILVLTVALLVVWHRRRESEVPLEVRVTDETVELALTSGEARSVRIDSLRAVDLITTDQGPFVDDVFWVLTPGEGEPVVIPSEAPGVRELLSRLQDLEDFDHMAVIVAMGSPDNACFPCWRAADLRE